MAQKTSKRRDEIRAMDDGKLKEELTKLKKEQFNLRFQTALDANERASKGARIRIVRRDIARIKTIMTERKRASASA